MVACLVQIDGYDPVAAAAVTLYAASHDDPTVCMLNGQTWWPALAKLPVLRYDLFDGAFGGSITAPSSALTLQAEPWPNLGRYMLADARLRMWTGNVGDAWAAYTLRFDGRVTGQPKLADGKADVQFAVDDRWLDTAFLATYLGTTGVEGPAALKGQVKPLALGAPRYVPGKLIDSVNSVFQVSAYGAVQGFEYALEKLARFGAATGDFATYAALIAATLAPGTWATCKAAGLARFGAPPAGQISFLLQGDNSGTDGWARKPGQLIRRLALLSGGAGKIDDASLNALDAARPYNLSLYLEEQTTAREMIQKLAASVNAVAGVSWTGQLFVLPVAIGAAAVTLAADGSSLPPVGTVQQIEIAAPFRKLALTAERAWTVHQLSDIASTATLIDLGGYAAGTTYREGNIVELPDGSRFMYSAVTPTAGNVPPNVTYWNPLPSAAPTDFAVVVGATRPADNAGTSGVLTPLGTYVTITGNTVRKIAGAVTGEQGAAVGSALANTAFISAGLLWDASSHAGGYYTYLALDTNATGYSPSAVKALAIFVSISAYGGTLILVLDAATVTSVAVSGLTTSSRLRLRYDGTRFVASIGTAETMQAAPPALTLWPKVCLYNIDTATEQQGIVDVLYGPWSENAQPSIDGPSSIAIAADATGTPVQATTTHLFKRLLGATDVSASTTWNIASSAGCTVSVSGGVVTRTGTLAATAKFTLRSVRDGVTKDLTVTFNRDDAPPSYSTGGSSGAGTAGTGNVASTSTSNSYGTAGSESAFSCVAGSGGSVALTCNVAASINRTSGGSTNEYLYGKLQWRIAGGTWADVTTETASDAPAVYTGPGDADGATIAMSPTKTGLTAGSTYEFRFLERRGATTSAVTASFSGTIGGVGG